MHETIQQVLRDRMHDDGIAVRYDDRTWTWREHLAEAAAEASALIGVADPARPLHVGVLLGNTPAMLRSMAAAGLGGYVLCGINTTRRGAGLLADIRRADCQLLLIDSDHRPLLDGLDLTGITVLDVASPAYPDAVASAAPLVAHREVTATDPLMLIFTSGTSGNPKAVPFTHVMAVLPRRQPRLATRRHRRRRLLRVDAAVPLQRRRGRLGGRRSCAARPWSPARSSRHRRFLDDVRRYGATYLNYVGKPLSYVLATPERPDDADNPLRVAFGNEAGRPRHRRVRAPLRLPGDRRLRLHRDSPSSSSARTAPRRAPSARAVTGVAVYDADDRDRVRARAVRRDGAR